MFPNLKDLAGKIGNEATAKFNGHVWVTTGLEKKSGEHIKKVLAGLDKKEVQAIREEITSLGAILDEVHGAGHKEPRIEKQPVHEQKSAVSTEKTTAAPVAHKAPAKKAAAPHKTAAPKKAAAKK